MVELSKKLGILSDNLHSVISKFVEIGLLSIEGSKIKVSKNLSSKPSGSFYLPSVDILYMI